MSTRPAAAASRLRAAEPHPLTLRFLDPSLEAQFRRHEFDTSLAMTRVAFVLGIALWVVWGLLVRDYLGADAGFDQAMRYGLFIPILVLGLALSFTRVFRRAWQALCTVALVVTGAAWIAYVSGIDTMPVDYGYVGVILIMTFGYTLIRLPIVYVAAISAALIVTYLAIGLRVRDLTGAHLTLSAFYLVSFGTLGLIASYLIERSSRVLFLRERQLDREHERSEGLLVNVLPQVIADRLKRAAGRAEAGRIADSFDEVTVLFADAVGFTLEAERTEPGALVGALDDLFSRFDVIADDLAMEKIKTVGDAYMTVAGAPTPRADHAACAARMALAILDAVRDVRWPSGAPVTVRIGIASGPVVAGIIGRRKFAYDLWGDTVNLASRLETHGEPGRILVSEAVAERLRGEFLFTPTTSVDLKGKGPTRACFLVASIPA